MSSLHDGDPFKIGRRYLVRKSFESLRDAFTEGEVVTYQEKVYSWYDGYTGFIFSDAKKDSRVWDVHDDDSVEIWSTLFQELT